MNTNFLSADVPPSPNNITAFQKTLHAMSSQQSLSRKKTKGAFGGVSKDDRAVRNLARRFSK